MKLESVKNYFFIIKESWLENIKLLKPQNLSKLLLVSLRASIESLKSLSPYLLIFFALLLLRSLYLADPSILPAVALSELWRTTLLGMPGVALAKTGASGHMKLIGLVRSLLCLKYLMSLALILLFLLMILSLRASVELKNQKYYLGHLYYFIPATLIYLIYYFVDKNLDIKLFIIPALWMFFLIDSKLTIQNFFASGYRVLLMLIYNLPVFILIRFVIFGLINFLKLSKLPINYFVPNLPVWSGLIFYIILYLLLTYFVALIGKIYIKRVHEQFNLYF